MGAEGQLREGFTTGTALTAAVQGALDLLLGQGRPGTVEVELPGRRSWRVELAELTRRGPEAARCSVIKDAGDDPDLTHQAEVGAEVEIRRARGGGTLPPIIFRAGPGVGLVTRPGLPLAVGEPAINPGPRRMINRAIARIVEQYNGQSPIDSLAITAFITHGVELAARTLNPKLGIRGGLSILGTTGVVRPYSHAAYRATIVLELRVARSAGLATVVLATGRSSGELAQVRLGLAPLAVVKMGDHLAFSLRQARQEGFRRLVVAAFFGKALKMAWGQGNLRFDQASLGLERLAGLVQAGPGDGELALAVAQANTARHALELILSAGRIEVVAQVGQRAWRFCQDQVGPAGEVAFLLFDDRGEVLFQAGPRGGA